ncbi:MAG: hypothetical protein JF627_06980 [Alphaproteobacteria bacterium]|nr:hypothetical protein [Alphaproteobacteria bacterium]
MRRRNLIAGVMAAGAAVMAGLYRFTDLLVMHYPPTPYDDLLVQLVDRGQAARLGAKVTDAAGAASLAAELRSGLKPGTLRKVAEAEVAAGRVAEVDGWVLPKTVALLSALAAKV